MPLDPRAKELVDQMAALPPLETLTVLQARARALEMARRFGAGEPVARVEVLDIPGPDGDIAIRVYAPDGKGPWPVLVFFHGGGWVVGNLETADFYCRAVTNTARCLVASVNYRHAPEHNFPSAVEDAYAAAGWIAANAPAIGGDPARLAAGGNLAAVAATIARDRGAPRIVCQVLSVPVMDYNFETRSYRENADGYELTRSGMQWFWGHYLQSPADGAHPHASPLRAQDLRGLPPAFISTAEFDPLRDEGEEYARKLAAAGVPVTLKRYDGMVHMFLGPDSIPDLARHLRAAFRNCARRQLQAGAERAARHDNAQATPGAGTRRGGLFRGSSGQILEPDLPSRERRLVGRAAQPFDMQSPFRHRLVRQRCHARVVDFPEVAGEFGVRQDQPLVRGHAGQRLATHFQRVHPRFEGGPELFEFIAPHCAEPAGGKTLRAFQGAVPGIRPRQSRAHQRHADAERREIETQ
jgi:acetyl esterase